MKTPIISIVIPTLNEVENLNTIIDHTITMAAESNSLEIIVVDGGSTDGTLESLQREKVKAFSKPEFALRKYKNLNFGLEQAKGDIVMFLDADTRLPKHFDKLILTKLKKEKVVGGAFEFSFEKPNWKLTLLTIVNRVRYRLDKVYYGDQAIFSRRTILEEIGGVPEKPLMEAAYLCKALGRKGRLSLITAKIKTSPRRFNEHGFFKVAWFDINMFIRFNLGLPVDAYANGYWSKNLKN